MRQCICRNRRHCRQSIANALEPGRKAGTRKGMMDDSRRDFLKTCAMIGAAMQLGEFAAPDALGATTGPALSIAHYRTSPQAPEEIAEEARRLTVEAVNGLGGMGRFISKGDVVWVKP